MKPPSTMVISQLPHYSLGAIDRNCDSLILSFCIVRWASQLPSLLRRTVAVKKYLVVCRSVDGIELFSLSITFRRNFLFACFTPIHLHALGLYGVLYFCFFTSSITVSSISTIGNFTGLGVIALNLFNKKIVRNWCQCALPRQTFEELHHM